MTIRLFAALPIPLELGAELVGLQRGIPNAKWRPVDAFHVTLRFVGEVNQAVATELDEALALIESEPFDVSLVGAGVFGGDLPHAVWLGVERSEPLELLAARCERVCRRIGLSPDTRKWTPHVTMAYLNTSADPGRIAQWVANNATYRSGSWLADRFHLYSSWLGKGPSRYEAEAEYPLAPAL